MNKTEILASELELNHVKIFKPGEFGKPTTASPRSLYTVIYSPFPGSSGLLFC